MRFYNINTLQSTETEKEYPDLPTKEAACKLYSDDYVPSVTTVLEIIRKEQIEEYRRRLCLDHFAEHKDKAKALEYEDLKFSAFGDGAHACVSRFLLELRDGPSEATQVTTDPLIAKHAQPAIDFLKKAVRYVVYSEQKFADPTLDYGGTIDIVYIDEHDQLVVADLKFKKNSSRYPMKATTENAYQLAAYGKYVERILNQPSKRLSLICASPFGFDTQPKLLAKWWEDDHYPSFQATHLIWKEDTFPELLR